MKRIWCLLLCIALCVCLGATATAQATPTDTTATDKNADTANTIVIDDCESAEGWTCGLTDPQPMTLDTQDPREGEACVSTTYTLPAEGERYYTVSAGYEQPLDLTGFSVLELDIYISDLRLLSSSIMAMVTMSSGGKPDSQAISWDLLPLLADCKAGWNHISLPVGAASGQSGFVSSAVNYLGLYLLGLYSEEPLEDVVIKLDNITATIPTYTSIQLDSCDDTTGWSGWGSSVATQDTSVKKEGVASVRMTSRPEDGGNLVYHKNYGAVFNAKGALYVEMDVYISDIRVLQASYSNYGLEFEITSSGTCDQQEYSWSLKDYVFEDGWNTIQLPIAEARVSGGEPNLAAINFIRFHMLGMHTVRDGLLYMRVDNIRFVVPAGEMATEIVVTPYEPEVETPPEETDPPEQSTPPEDETQQPSEDATALRAKQTAQRAKIVVILMSFSIIGVDFVVVSLRRRSAGV